MILFISIAKVNVVVIILLLAEVNVVVVILQFVFFVRSMDGSTHGRGRIFVLCFGDVPTSEYAPTVLLWC
jgi:hypothetical protein